MDSFYYTLQSNASLDVHRRNKAANFKIQLPKRITLTGEWVVGLAEIHFPTQFETFEHPHPEDPTSEAEVEVARKRAKRAAFFDPIGLAASMEIIKYNRDKMRNLERKHLSAATLPANADIITGKPIVEDRFSYDAYSSTDSDPDTETLAVPEQPAKVTEPKSTPQQPVKVAEHKSVPQKSSEIPKLETESEVLEEYVKLIRRPKQIYIYCDIVELEYIGDKYGSFLRVASVPPYHTMQKTAEKEYIKPHYKRLAHNNFDSLEIDIRDVCGCSVPFAKGSVVIATLHFKRVR
jgi:hypothetical protein